MGTAGEGKGGMNPEPVDVCSLPCAIAGGLAGSCRRDREPSPALCDGLEVWNGGGGRLKNKGIYIYTTMSNSC